MLAKSYMADKKFDKARELYARVPDSLMTAESRKYYVASIFSSGGDTIKAMEILRKLVDENPSDCVLSMELGNRSFQLKRNSDVVSIFTKRIANCPNEPKATPYLFIGLAYLRDKKYDSAIVALSNSIVADSSGSNMQAYLWLMNSYYSNKQYDKSVEVARQIIQKPVDNANKQMWATAYFFIGKSRFDAKDYKGAISNIEESLKLDPESGQSYLFMAASYQFLQDKDNACKYYHLGLKHDPKNVDLQKNMKALGCS